MDRRITIVFVLFSFLMLPTTASMETDMSFSVFEEGCACHGEPSEGDNPLAVGHFLGDASFSGAGGFIPGETYTGMISVLGPGLNESNSNNTVFHLIATDGELNFSGQSLAWSNTVKHNDTWLSTHHSSMVERWEVEWTAPANVTDYRPVNLTLYGMRANGDGVPNDADFWAISSQTIWTNPVWVDNYQQNNTNTSNNPGVNEIPFETQAFIRNHFLGPDPSTIGDGHPNWDCYEWGYWNWQELDASSESLGCPYYQALIANDADDKMELTNDFLGEFLSAGVEIFFDHGFWIVLLIGLLGCLVWYLSEKTLERFLEEDERILAARNSMYESISLICFYGIFLYGTVTFALLALFGWRDDQFYEWSIIGFVRINSSFGWIVCLISLFIFSAGFAKAGNHQHQISKLHYAARIKLIGGGSPSYVHEEESQDEEEDSLDDERTEPVTFAEILDALDTQLKEAIEEAHDLREELEETKTKVITLEEEVQEKDLLIGEIEASKTTLAKEIDREEKEEMDHEGKKLSLTDSVMVGDSIMGGMKIDKQINNDPDAIARAVIAAYRAGREDKE